MKTSIGLFSIITLVVWVFAIQVYGSKDPAVQIIGENEVSKYYNSYNMQDVKNRFGNKQPCVYIGTFNSTFHDEGGSFNVLGSSRITIMSEGGFASLGYMVEFEPRNLTLLQDNIKSAIAQLYHISDWKDDKLYTVLQKNGVQIFITSCGFRLDPKAGEKQNFTIISRGIVSAARRIEGKPCNTVLIAVFQGQGEQSFISKSNFGKFNQRQVALSKEGRLSIEGEPLFPIFNQTNSEPAIMVTTKDNNQEITLCHPSKVTTFYAIVIDGNKIFITHVLLDASDDCFVLKQFLENFKRFGFQQALIYTWATGFSWEVTHSRKYGEYEKNVFTKTLRELGTLGGSDCTFINRERSFFKKQDNIF